MVDGDNVFDLRIVATPGHTPGHIAVLDEALGVLVAGDALTTNDGRPTSYPIASTEDMEEAQRSVAKLAALDFETLFVGHGEPIQSGAAALVREFLDVCPLDHDLEPPLERSAGIQVDPISELSPANHHDPMLEPAYLTSAIRGCSAG